MPEAVAVELITTIGLIVVALLQLQASRNASRDRKANEAYRREREERDRERQRMDAAMQRGMMASLDSSLVLLHQAHGDHLNGNVEHAMKGVEGAKGDFEKIRDRLAVSAMSE